jgi:hypothetical protein
MHTKLVFHHIPKTAGTSLRQIIFSELLEIQQSYWHYTTPLKLEIEVTDFFSLINLSNLEGLTQIDASKARDKLKFEFFRKEFVGGHLTFPDYKKLVENLGESDSAVHVAVLRDPFERLVSYWEFCQRQDDHPFKYGGEFEDALNSEHPFFRNCTWEQNYYISGKRDFNQSLETLNNNKFVLFDLSRLNDFASTIRLAFNESDSKFLKQDTSAQTEDVKKSNVNPNKSYIEKYIKYRPLVSELLSEDQKLYDYVIDSGGILKTFSN